MEVESLCGEPEAFSVQGPGAWELSCDELPPLNLRAGVQWDRTISSS